MKTFKEFQDFVKATAKGHDEKDTLPTYAALGLAGECGEFVEMVKKAYRGDGPLDYVAAASELGDAMWYIARAAFKLGIPLQAIAEITEYKLTARKTLGKNHEREHDVMRQIIALSQGDLPDIDEGGSDGRTFGLV